MRKRAIKVFGECYEPDVTFSYNFVFDTTTINKIAERPQDIEVLEAASEKLGYEYFRCRIQDEEIEGIKSDGTIHSTFSKLSPKSLQMKGVVERLSIRKIPCLAKFVERGIASTDINYLKNSDGKLFEVFQKVFNENIDNLEDAIIVEAGIRYNCTIISNDRAMCENTIKEFPGKAVLYQKFIKDSKEKIKEK